MDTTIKGIPVNQDTIEKILNEILSKDLNDNVIFKIKGIKNIHAVSDYDDFRVSIEAQFFTIKVNIKIDITTGDLIIPREVDYEFRLMFEDRKIEVKAYNLNTVLAEKIESIIARNVSNTRARDFYDVYILLTLRKYDIDMDSLREALKKKAEERNTLIYLEQCEKYLNDIDESKDILKIWNSYKEKYSYAEGIEFSDIMDVLRDVLRK